jgi:predicted  nucleic acid-binding Zn-ribbon protein
MKFLEIRESQEELQAKKIKLQQLEKRRDDMESALTSAREATKLIKYDDTTTEIFVKLSSLADQVGIEEKELEYYANQVREASNNLESKVYEMEDVFSEQLRDLSNACDDLEYEIDYPEDY